MKIGVLISSYDGCNSPFEKYDQYQDPSRYVTNHDFELRFITKKDAYKQLDEVKKEGFDLWINFMWGQRHDNVAGIDAVAYAETLGVPMVGTSSKFLSLSKIDFKLAASKYNILTPRYKVIKSREDNITLENFPVIVKSARDCGSLHMTKTSVCSNSSELKCEISRVWDLVQCELLVEEYIFGREYSVIVIENTNGIDALSPIVFKFPDSFALEEQFLDFENKFKRFDKGEITFELVDEAEPLFNKIKQVACQAYNSIHVYGSGYARIDLRVDNQNNIYVLEINPTPAFFSPIGNNFGDDYEIKKSFPGGHEALLDQIIETKMKLVGIAHKYDVMSAKYNELTKDINLYQILTKLLGKYEYNGDVLDLGCGTGRVGEIITSCKQNAKLIGVDVSPKMAKQAKLYSQVHRDSIENFVFNIDEQTFDHVLSIGCLHFLNNVVFEEVIRRLFEIARKSITISIEEIPDVYNEMLIKKGCHCIYSYNNKSVIDDFNIPENWILAHSEHNLMWCSPTTGINIHGLILRFESNQKGKSSV